MIRRVPTTYGWTGNIGPIVTPIPEFHRRGFPPGSNPGIPTKSTPQEVGALRWVNQVRSTFCAVGPHAPLPGNDRTLLGFIGNRETGEW